MLERRAALLGRGAQNTAAYTINKKQKDLHLIRFISANTNL